MIENNKPVAGLEDYDTDEFKDFLDENPKLKQARGELQILYFHTLLYLAPAKLLIYDSYRPPKTQEKLVEEGKSQTEKSLHNYNPSFACDHIPTLNGVAKWKSYRQLHFVYGVIYAIFRDLQKKYNWPYNIRSGMDWGMTNYTENKTTLYDPGHIELRTLDYKP